jgi:hypothetical protein
MTFITEVRDAKSEIRATFEESDFAKAIKMGQAQASKYPHTKVSYVQPAIAIYELTKGVRHLVYYELCLEDV